MRPARARAPSKRSLQVQPAAGAVVGHPHTRREEHAPPPPHTHTPFFAGREKISSAQQPPWRTATAAGAAGSGGTRWRGREGRRRDMRSATNGARRTRPPSHPHRRAPCARRAGANSVGWGGHSPERPPLRPVSAAPGESERSASAPSGHSEAAHGSTAMHSPTPRRGSGHGRAPSYRRKAAGTPTRMRRRKMTLTAQAQLAERKAAQ
mmetsp:Transcript_41255/g.96406  ORF Transcript_41255/g.96406 Transcript_41255/m.96406 type:complete len:208 (-) Transcript_41255:1644-2267(-)